MFTFIVRILQEINLYFGVFCKHWANVNAITKRVGKLGENKIIELEDS